MIQQQTNWTDNKECINNQKELQDDLEFQKNKEEFKNLVKKYLGYRSEWNKLKINEFLNSLDVTNFNKILNYFEEQRDKTKNFEIKQDLAILYSEILEKRNNALNDSRDRLYSTNMEVEKWWIINSEWKTVDSDNKVKSLKGSNVELLPNWEGYLITLDFWEWEPQIFHVEYTKDKTLIIKDEFNNHLKCNIELMWMDLKKENIWLWQERIINIKKFRILVWNLFFVLKFND